LWESVFFVTVITYQLNFEAILEPQNGTFNHRENDKMRTGLNKAVISFLLVAICLIFANMDASATTLDGKKYGVGFQVLSPELAGIGMLIDVGNTKATVQPILGFDPFPSAGFRLKYAFARKRFLDLYASGLVGYGNDNLFGGIGAGVEWDWRMLEKTLPPVSLSFEIGFHGSDLGFGIGAHYTF
jgi:hypothetical protein